jgi:hypothetical protein
VVTLLTVPLLALLLELEFDDEPVVCELVDDDVPVSEPELVLELVVVAGVDATVVADEALAASAGSWPDTSTIVISSHAATNSATDPPMMRRRIMRTRPSRAALIAWPRARASCGLLLFMVRYLVVGHGRSEAVGSFEPPHLTDV